MKFRFFKIEVLVSVVGAILMVIAGYHVVDTIKEQRHLERVFESKFTNQVRGLKNKLLYHLNLRRANFRHITSDYRLMAFFINKRLGMSMQYGLRVSLYEVEEFFKSLVEPGDLQSKMYNSLVLLDSHHGIVTQEGEYISKRILEHVLSKGNEIFTLVRNKGRCLLCVSGVVNGGSVEQHAYGYVVGCFDGVEFFKQAILPREGLYEFVRALALLDDSGLQLWFKRLENGSWMVLTDNADNAAIRNGIEGLTERLEGTTCNIAVFKTPILLPSHLEEKLLVAFIAISLLLVMVFYLRRNEKRLKQLTYELERARADADLANRAKSKFLARMTHDIRTPLTAIMGFAELLLQERDLTSRQRAHVQKILSSGRNLLDITTNILDISKIEASKVELDKRPFNIRALFEELSSTFSLIANRKSLAFNINIDPSLPVCVVGDRVKFRRILSNVIGNAIKYTDSGYVAVNVVSQKLGDSKIRVIVDIKDTGRGMEENEIERIFKAFHQAPLHGGGQVNGWGLGLKIAMSHAKLMEGDIKVSSEKGKGTIFSIEVVFEVGHYDDMSKEYIDTSEFENYQLEKPLNILICDDDTISAAVLKEFLESLGCFVRAASRGEEALLMLKTYRPDAVFMDLVMPGMDGYECIRKIRKEYAPERLKIVACSSEAFVESVSKAKEAGADYFLPKPFTFSEIRRCLMDCFGIELKKAAVDKKSGKEAQRQNLADVPKELVETLADAIIKADLHEFREALKELRKYNRALADELDELVSEYRYEDILQRLGIGVGDGPLKKVI